jgi:hypothetical protein
MGVGSVAVIISKKINAKLAERHGVAEHEVLGCFANRDGKMLLDSREKHASNPPTLWFIAETNQGRKLKVIFIQEGGDVYLRSAFPPDDNELRIYNKYGK